ncbi:MAG: hypothetical protein JHC93_08730 [Parachlamydiales bacterium]|nr:hypothetical protein [Parachlamydiales bacterium]
MSVNNSFSNITSVYKRKDFETDEEYLEKNNGFVGNTKKLRVYSHSYNAEQRAIIQNTLDYLLSTHQKFISFRSLTNNVHEILINKYFDLFPETTQEKVHFHIRNKLYDSLKGFENLEKLYVNSKAYSVKDKRTVKDFPQYQTNCNTIICVLPNHTFTQTEIIVIDKILKTIHAKKQFIKSFEDLTKLVFNVITKPNSVYYYSFSENITQQIVTDHLLRSLSQSYDPKDAIKNWMENPNFYTSVQNIV